MGKRKQIGSKLIYTCKCGWIDKNHAFATSDDITKSAGGLWKQITSESGKKSKNKEAGFKVTYQQAMGVSVFGYIIGTGITHDYYVKSGLSGSQKESVALGIFTEVSYAFEQFQGDSIIARKSSYSIEDLVSNLIGFYTAVKGENYLPICGPVSKQASQDIYDLYKPFDVQNFGFGAYLYPCKECDRKLQGPICAALPEVFYSIIPAKKGEGLYRDWQKSLDEQAV